MTVKTARGAAVSEPDAAPAAQENPLPKLEAQPAPEAVPAGFPMPLDAFCAALSGEDKRSTLIAAFHHDETANDRLFDTDAAYRARYVALARRPA